MHEGPWAKKQSEKNRIHSSDHSNCMQKSYLLCPSHWALRSVISRAAPSVNELGSSKTLDTSSFAKSKQSVCKQASKQSSKITLTKKKYSRVATSAACHKVQVRSRIKIAHLRQRKNMSCCMCEEARQEQVYRTCFRAEFFSAFKRSAASESWALCFSFAKICASSLDPAVASWTRPLSPLRKKQKNEKLREAKDVAKQQGRNKPVKARQQKESCPIKSLAAEGRAGCALPSRKRASAGITARIMTNARKKD